MKKIIIEKKKNGCYYNFANFHEIQFQKTRLSFYEMHHYIMFIYMIVQK